MKRFMLLIIGMILLQSVYAQSGIPLISVALLNQDPDPVEPGEYVEVRLKVQNSGTQATAGNLEVKLVEEFPFSLDPTTNAVKEIGDLPSLGEENVAVVRYTVRVDEDAVEGINELKVQYRHEGTNWITRDFPIDIQTTDANLAVVSIETDPEKIVPGEEATVNLIVENLADSTMRDVTVKLDLTFSRFLGQSTIADPVSTFNTLPFAPVGSATEKKINSLKGGEQHEFSYQLIAFADAEPKVYKIPVEISYNDEVGNEYVKQDIIGLVVGTNPDMSVVIDETDLVVGRQAGTVSVRFINKGFTDVKFLDVILEDAEVYDLLCCQEVYIGNVDSDDYEIAEFELYLNEVPKEEITIPLVMQAEYRDANNVLYEETYELPLRILSPDKLSEGNGGSNTILFVILGVVAVVGIYLYRRRKKKK